MDQERSGLSVEGVSKGDATLTRRGFLRGTAMIGIGATLAAPLFGLAGCSSDNKGNDNVKMGIGLGNQTLWRYIAYRNDQLLKPLGYSVTFLNYLDGGHLVADFLGGQIDVCATVVSALPALAASADVQMFLPIGWMKTGFPIVAPSSSSLRSVADLQGKRLVILGPDHPSTTYWEALVRQNYGFSLKAKTEAVDLAKLEGTTPIDPLKDGRADAAIVESNALTELLSPGSYRQIGDLRAEWVKVSRSNRLLVYGGYLAKSPWLKANSKFVEDLIRLNYEALKGYKTDRATLIDPSAAYVGEGAPQMSKESSAYVADYLGYDDVEPERAYLSSTDIEDYRTMVSLLTKAELLKAPPPDVAKSFYLSDKRPKQASGAP